MYIFEKIHHLTG